MHAELVVRLSLTLPVCGSPQLTTYFDKAEKGGENNFPLLERQSCENIQTLEALFCGIPS